ncbi:hypothetical protein JKP88DRAFT_243897 [Tribonema minus]|uniref:CCHC-type domain-containing protein n=1 Tax=Tribonema minus TaxID=303371 RepID=A0A835Z9K6_9STRA|nr:hypothetical protein JKP88DRAFT_243897 [Tribonema minus]
MYKVIIMELADDKVYVMLAPYLQADAIAAAHFAGGGIGECPWTQRYRPRSMTSTRTNNPFQLEAEVRLLMRHRGIDNVRGGPAGEALDLPNGFAESFNESLMQIVNQELHVAMQQQQGPQQVVDQRPHLAIQQQQGPQQAANPGPHDAGQQQGEQQIGPPPQGRLQARGRRNSNRSRGSKKGAKRGRGSSAKVSNRGKGRAAPRNGKRCHSASRDRSRSSFPLDRRNYSQDQRRRSDATTDNMAQARRGGDRSPSRSTYRSSAASDNRNDSIAQGRGHGSRSRSRSAYGSAAASDNSHRGRSRSRSPSRSDTSAAPRTARRHDNQHEPLDAAGDQDSPGSYRSQESPAVTPRAHDTPGTDRSAETPGAAAEGEEAAAAAGGGALSSPEEGQMVSPREGQHAADMAPAVAEEQRDDPPQPEDYDNEDHQDDDGQLGEREDPGPEQPQQGGQHVRERGDGRDRGHGMRARRGDSRDRGGYPMQQQQRNSFRGQAQYRGGYAMQQRHGCGGQAYGNRNGCGGNGGQRSRSRDRQGRQWGGLGTERERNNRMQENNMWPRPECDICVMENRPVGMCMHCRRCGMWGHKRRDCRSIYHHITGAQL